MNQYEYDNVGWCFAWTQIHYRPWDEGYNEKVIYLVQMQRL